MRFAVRHSSEEGSRKGQLYRHIVTELNDPDLLSVAVLSVTSGPLVVPDVCECTRSDMTRSAHGK
jgi:hypothetical protein